MTVHKITMALISAFLFMTTSYADLPKEKLLDTPEFSHILAEVKSDVKKDLNDNLKEEFKEYYKTNVQPRIKNLRLSNLKMIKANLDFDGQNEILLWTEGLAPSTWGPKEFLYILSKSNGVWQIKAKQELKVSIKCNAPMQCGYAYSKYYPDTIPNISNPSGGAFVFADHGGSGSTYYMIVPYYNRYLETFHLAQYALPYPIKILPNN